MWWRGRASVLMLARLGALDDTLVLWYSVSPEVIIGLLCEEKEKFVVARCSIASRLGHGIAFRLLALNSNKRLGPDDSSTANPLRTIRRPNKAAEVRIRHCQVETKWYAHLGFMGNTWNVMLEKVGLLT